MINSPGRSTLIILILAMLSASGVIVFYLTAHSATPGVSRRADVLDRFAPGEVRREPPIWLEKTQRKPIVLSDGRILSPAFGLTSDTLFYYEKTSGQIVRTTLDHKSHDVLFGPLPNLAEIIWSPTRQQVIALVSVAGKGGEYRFIDLATKRTVSLGATVRSVSFAPPGDRIAYIRTDAGSLEIVLARPDGSIPKTIFKTRAMTARIFWQKEDLLYLAVQGNTDWNLFSLTPAGDLVLVLEHVTDLEALWSRSGQKLLYSRTAPDGKTLLAVRDMSSREESLLSLATPASRCAWNIAETTIFCAAVLSDFGGIHEIALESGESKLIALASSLLSLNIQEILLSSLEDYLVFVNENDGRIYSVRR